MVKDSYCLYFPLRYYLRPPSAAIEKFVHKSLAVGVRDTVATTPVSRDQRKRTLEEALERRFAVAKAKLLQQKKNDKTFVEEDGKGTPRRNSSFLNTLIATSSNSSSKKGNFPFLGPSISQVF
ncbi:hypothetical protein V6N13_092615 [Hibiscus sabdariffa]